MAILGFSLAYVLVSVVVAIAISIADIRSGRQVTSDDMFFNIILGCAWPFTVFFFAVRWLSKHLLSFCFKLADAIDRHVAEDAKKHVEKPEPRMFDDD